MTCRHEYIHTAEQIARRTDVHAGMQACKHIGRKTGRQAGTQIELLQTVLTQFGCLVIIIFSEKLI